LNNAGDVGLGEIPYNGAQVAAVWRAGGEAEVLGGTYASEAELFDLNDAGTAVGWSVGYGPGGSLISGYVAGADGTLTYYPVSFVTGTGYIPNAINSAGVMAGVSESAGGVMVVSGPGVNRSFTVGWGSLHAYALNSSNQTVGIYDYARTGGIAGMFFDDGAVTHTYTSVFGMGQVFGYSLSDKGVVVGTAAYTPQQHEAQGDRSSSALGFMMFRPGDEGDSGVVALEPLEGYTDSGAAAGNDANWAVGDSVGYPAGGYEQTATLWDGEDGTAYDLNTLVGDLPAGMQLVGAMDINDRGEIVAEGDDASGGYLVLLTPVDGVPEPGALGILGVVGLFGCGGRKGHGRDARAT
jgi:hypothetical protein